MTTRIIAKTGNWKAYSEQSAKNGVRFFVEEQCSGLKIRAVDEHSAIEILWCLARHTV